MVIVRDTIERDDVLEILFEALRRHASGWFLVVGGPGTGKSVLLQQAFARLRKDVSKPRLALVEQWIARGSQALASKRLAAQLDKEVRATCGLAPSPAADLSDTLNRIAAKGRRLVIVIDGLDAVQLDAEWHDQLFPAELPDGVRVIAGFRRTAKLQVLEAEFPRCTIDLDDTSLRQSNLRLVRRYWERERRLAQDAIPEQLVDSAVRACNGNIQYAVTLKDWLASNTVGRPSLDALPDSFSAFLQKAWRDVVKANDGRRKELETGFGVLCAARQPLTRAELMTAASWEPQACDAFIDAASPLLREEGANPPAYDLYHPALRESLVAEHFARLQPYHEMLLGLCRPFDGLWSGDTPVGAALQEHRTYVARNYVYHLLGAKLLDDAWSFCTDVEFLVWAASICGLQSILEDMTTTMAAASVLDAQRRTDIATVLSQHVFRLADADASELRMTLPAAIFNGLAGSSWTENEIAEVFRFGALLPKLRLRRPAQSTIGWKYAFSFSRSGIVDMAVVRDAMAVSLLDGTGTLTRCCLRTGRIDASPTRQLGPARLAAVAADSADVVYVPSDREVRLQRPLENRPVVLGRHDVPVALCAIDPSGALGATADEKGTLHVWDLAAGALRRTWQTERQPSALALGRAGCVLVGYSRGPITALRLDGGADHEFAGEFAAHSIAIDRDEKMFVVGHRHGELTTMTMDRGVRRTWKAHTGPIYACAFSQDGTVIMSGGGDRSIALWDRDGHKKRRLRGHLTRVVRVVATQDRSHIVSAGANGTLLAWDANAVLGSREPSPWLCCKIVRPARLPAGARLPPLTCIASVSEDGRIHLWSATENGVDRKNVGTGQFYTCALSPDGATVVGGTDNGHLFRFDVGSGELQSSVDVAHNGRVLQADWCPDSDVVASCGDDRCIVISNRSGKVRLLAGHSSEVRTCAFVSKLEDMVLVSASSSREVFVWNVRSGRRIDHFRSSSPVIACKRIRPDTIGLVCEDGAFITWRLDRKPEILFHLPAPVLDFSAVGVGRHIVTADQDEALSVWNLDTKSRVSRVFGPAIVRSVDACDDHVVAGDAMGNLYISDFVGV